MANPPGAARDQQKPRELQDFVFSAVVRAFTGILGLAAVAWAVSTMPIFLRQSDLEQVADEIVSRDDFRSGALEPLLPLVAEVERAAYCRPEALHSAAIIRMRLAEDAMVAAARDSIDPRLSELEQSLRLSLACTPSDPFLWMALAWVDNAREGYRPMQLDALRLSYRLGRNEGWIAARRNRLALAMFSRLPPDLAEEAVEEFGRMVNSWIWESFATFIGPGWPVRDRLLVQLANVGEPQRQVFAMQLRALGVDVAVPGVAQPPRPWK